MCIYIWYVYPYLNFIPIPFLYLDCMTRKTVQEWVFTISFLLRRIVESVLCFPGQHKKFCCTECEWWERERSLLYYFRKLHKEESTVDQEDWKSYFPTIKCKLHKIRNFAQLILQFILIFEMLVTYACWKNEWWWTTVGRLGWWWQEEVLEIWTEVGDTTVHKWKLLSLVWLYATTWTVACQAPLSMGFSGQEYWTALSFPSPGDLPDPGTEPGSVHGSFWKRCENKILGFAMSCKQILHFFFFSSKD